MNTNEINYPYTKYGKPVLSLEVIGDVTTFKGIGELLFEHYLGDILHEDLFEHVGDFNLAIT